MKPVPVPAPPTDDRDADGVPDAQDRCPDEPEDRDQFEDGDGCVDRDNDGDGILDAHELRNGRWTNCDYRPENGVDTDCRNLPEDFDGSWDYDGCPDTIRLDQCAMKLTDRVVLDRRGRATLDAPKVLDELAALMNATPDAEFWIEAHIDRQRDAATAKRITQRAAQDVIEALVLRGVARERLEPIGWGHDKPLPRRTTTAAERANDRRVEFSRRACEGGSGPPFPDDTAKTHECR